MILQPLYSQATQAIVIPQSVAGAVAANQKDATNSVTTNKPTAEAQNKPDSIPPYQQKAGVAPNDPEVLQVIAQLKARDQEVRTHEQAHVAAGGQYVTSGPSYSYQTGPDGTRYAIGGSVGIDVSPIANDPQATINKARQVMQAAMAPAEPSSQDYAVAQSAQNMMLQAQQELAKAPGNSEEDEANKGVNQPESDSTMTGQALDANKQKDARLYEQTDQATNGLVGRIGGYQDSALRLGVRFQA